MTKIKYPFGPADTVTIDAPTAAGHDVTIDNQVEIVKITGMTAATTLNLAASDDLKAGAKVVVDIVQGATGRNVTFGGSAVAPVLTGVANDRDTVAFIYDGTEFIGLGTTKIVDAA